MVLSLVAASLLSGAPVPYFSLWLERGGNLESLGNERFFIKYDGAIVYERGVAFSRKEKGEDVTTGRCERFVWKLQDAELESMKKTLSDANVEALEPSYRKNVEDGSQAALLVQLGPKVIVSQFDNSFPPAYQAVAGALRKLVERGVKASKAQRCDVATWFFLRPPNDEKK